MIRRYGEPVQNRKHRLRPGAYVILPLGDAILLTHQQNPKPEFQLPGGGIDPGESPLMALHREVLEETGYRIAYPRRIGAFRRFVFMPEYDWWAEKVCHIFIARPTLRHGPPTEDGHSAIWAPAALAAGMLVDDGCRDFLMRATR